MLYPVARLRNARRIAEALRLRYRVFSAAGLIPEPYVARRAAMEADCFDRYSSLYGVLAFPRFALVGTVRMVLPRTESETAGIVQALVHESRDLRLLQGFEAAYSEELPVFQSFDGVQEILSARKGRYAELSRLIVDPAYRRRGLAERLVRFALAESRRTGIESVLLGCAPQQAPFYGRFGFSVEGDKVASFKRVRRESVLMKCDLGSTRPPVGRP